MDGLRRKRAGMTGGAGIGQQLDGDISLGQRRGQRLGGKQMAARAAGGDKDAARSHQAGLPAKPKSRRASISARGRSRVSASSMPMP